MAKERPNADLAPQRRTDEGDLDRTLRPQRLADYVGQEKMKAQLAVFLAAARERKEPIEHVLLCGPPGLGKTTMAYILANEMGVPLKITSGPALERQGDLAAILSNLEAGQVLFIDEIHRLAKAVEEILYPAMEDFRIDLVWGKGLGAKSVSLSLPKFTLVAATTRTGLLTGPLRDRFGAVHRLEFYDPSELTRIVQRSAHLLSVPLAAGAAEEIARRARGTPRIVNRLLRRVRDYAQVKSDGTITLSLARDALKMLEVDEAGLDAMDRTILSTIAEKFSGGPVGVETIAASVSEEPDTIEEVYEPYLLQTGFLQRTSAGRKLTALAYQHLGARVPPAAAQDRLL